MTQNQQYPFYIIFHSSGLALSLKSAFDCKNQLEDASDDVNVYREYFTILDGKICLSGEWSEFQRMLDPKTYQELSRYVLNWLESQVLYGQTLTEWNVPEYRLLIQCKIKVLQGKLDLELYDSTVDEINQAEGQVVLHSGNHVGMAESALIVMEENNNTIDTLSGTAYLSAECIEPVCIGFLCGNAIVKKDISTGGGIRLESHEDGSCYIFYIRYPANDEEKLIKLGITCSSYPPTDYVFTGWDELFWHVDSYECPDEEMQIYLKEIAEEIKVGSNKK